MAAGINYTDQVILGDYPCDIKSIVRYRGGFNLNSSMTDNFKGYRFPALTPLQINFTKREVMVNDAAFGTATDWDTTADFIKNSLAYNVFTIEEGTTITAILHADEVSFTGLNALRYYMNTGTEYEFDLYKLILKDAEQRTTLITTLDYMHNTYVW